MRSATPILLAFAVALSGCTARQAIDGSGDGGPASDAATVDASPRAGDSGPAAADAGVDADGPDPTIDGGAIPNGRSEYDDADSAFAGIQLCTDRLDNDLDGRTDCEDASCQRGVPSCCVGRSNVACCGAVALTELPVSGCDGAIDGCLASPDILALAAAPAVARDVGGETLITIEEREGDGGVTLDGALDPRGGVVTLDANIAAPMSDEEPIDAMGLAFIDASLEPTEVARVTPIAGFLVSRNRHQVSLMLAGQAVRSWAVDGESHDYQLSLDPTGLVTLVQDGSPLDTATIDWRAPVRAVLYGRGGLDSGSVTASRIGVGQSACDMPTALVRAPEVTIPNRPSFALGEALREPSVASSNGRERMVLRIGPDIHLAEPRDASFEITTVAPLLAETEQSWGTGGVADPALLGTNEGFYLFFTALDDDGSRSIGVVSEMSEDVFDVPSATQVLNPDDYPEIGGFSSPAPFVHDGLLHLALVEHRADGSHAIVVWQIDGGTRRLHVVREPRPDDLFAFDRDEVSAPSVVVFNSVTRIYFAGRRGTRWSIGVAVSDAAGPFRTIEDAEVLEATELGFDALGARDPAPYVDGDLVRLFYAGTDGSVTDIGSASGPIRTL